MGGVGVLALVVFVLVWFQPHKLFIDDRVDEDLPVAAADDGVEDPATDSLTGDGADEPADPPVAADGVVDLATGDFISRDHGTTGAVRVVELADGSRFVRLEDLATDNGPDLFVWLTTNTADGHEGAFRDEYVNLGRLKGNIGNQNYELPADVAIEEWQSVVIWCDRFSSAFGAADLVAT